LLYLIKGRIEAFQSLDGPDANAPMDGRLRLFLAARRSPAERPHVSPIIDLSVGQLAMALLLVAAIVVVSIRQSLGLERDLVVGTVRAIVQLYVVGLILTACSRPHVGIGSS